MLVYAATIFLSAVLLFQIQPMIAKAILPWFGGGAAVWTACMLFFQTVLLLGYIYAHVLTSRVNPKWQIRVHTMLLGLSLLLLPVVPDSRWRSIAPDNPVVSIIVVLAITVGLPYLVLSATTPLLQSMVRARQPFRITLSAVFTLECRFTCWTSSLPVAWSR